MNNFSYGYKTIAGRFVKIGEEPKGIETEERQAFEISTTIPRKRGKIPTVITPSGKVFHPIG